MTDDELIRRAKTGEVIGNGRRQIALLVRELACAEKDVARETSMYETVVNLCTEHERDLRHVAEWAFAERDNGNLYMGDGSPTHPEVHDGKTIQVYDHEYFSPLGDALIEG